MKKFIIMGALALSTLMLSQQDASAWFNTKFGIGMNWAWQSGGNNYLWGAFRNGQPPGPEYGSAFPGNYNFNFQQGPGYGPGPYPGHADMTPEPSSAPANAQAYRYYQPSYYQPNYQTVTYPSYYPSYYYPATYYYGR